MKSCDSKDFKKNYNKGLTQLYWRWIPADLETPVSVYIKLCESQPYSLLLESVEGGQTLGRYSIIACLPDLIFTSTDQDVQVWHEYGAWDMQCGSPKDVLEVLLEECHIDVVPKDLPPMAVSGLFGYMGYDMVREIENIPDTNKDLYGNPDSIFMRPQILCIFDHVKNMMCLVAPIFKHKKNTDETAEDVFQEAQDKLSLCENALLRPVPESFISSKTSLKKQPKIESNTKKSDFIKSVKKAIDYIYEGEIFQIVLGQVFSADFDLPSLQLYRSLRRLNPSPFLFHLQFEDFALVGSSPEILVRVRDNKVTIRPLAGTRPRGETPEQDKALANELLNDPKERAEHLMLLDLGRNDVGRVAQPKSIKVTEEFVIEYYSHVMHIVSNVEGILKTDLSVLDALFSGFPAGTVSGAPKIRAMEIIDELEKNRRGYYGGCVGYLSGNGDMDTCITLRTGLVQNGKLYVQAGAGIVADSKPEAEYQETVNKSQALFKAAFDALEGAEKN